MFGGGDEEKDVELAGSYDVFMSWADTLYKRGDYLKAIKSYSQALQFRAGDQLCLVSRSKAYLRLGDCKEALRDAEAALQDNKDYWRGMFQKAEALFMQGDFEFALVFYHRGNRLRPDLDSFRLGIQKSREAIVNCVGTPDIVRLDTSGDLSFFKAQVEKKVKKRLANPAAKKESAIVKRSTVRSANQDRTIRQMLGELYGDKAYLERLLKSADEHTDTGREINKLAEESLQYLDTRTEFWQQVKPMYARKYETRKAMTRYRPPKTTSQEYTLSEIERLDQLLQEGSHEAALKRAAKVMSVLEGYTETQLASLQAYKAKVHSVQGNAHLELGNYKESERHHQADLCLGREHEIREAESRGLDNLGRVFARMGRFQKAIDVWEIKLPMTSSPSETTWLCHELGRCYLERSQAGRAREYGERSLQAAQEAEDDTWQLHALVLISQAEVQSGHLSSSLISFELAHELAEVLMDATAQAAIKAAIRDVNARIAGKEEECRQRGPKERVAEDGAKTKKATGGFWSK